MSVKQIRITKGPYKGRTHDVLPFQSGAHPRLRASEAQVLLMKDWAEPVVDDEPERAVKAPEKRKAVKPAAKSKGKGKAKKKG